MESIRKRKEETSLKEVKVQANKLKQAIKDLRSKRKRSYIYYSRGEQFIKVINSIFSTLTMVGIMFQINTTYIHIFTLLTIISSWSLWANLAKKAANHMQTSADLQTAEDIVNTYIKRIDQLDKNDTISYEQQTQMTDMIIEIDVQLEHLSTCGRIYNVLLGISADSDIKHLCENFIDLTKKYNYQNHVQTSCPESCI